MHPYEVAQTLRSRHKHESIRLNFGSLYGVVASLEKRGLIEAIETVREGRRPERTIYRITEPGVIEMTDWLSELVAEPAKEYLGFEAALSLLPAVAPDEALDLLRQRHEALKVRLSRERAPREQAVESGVPRLFMLEGEYAESLISAEIDFVARLIDDLESGSVTGIDFWRAWHEGGELPDF